MAISTELIAALSDVQATHALLLQREGVIDGNAAAAILRAIDTGRLAPADAGESPWGHASTLEDRVDAALPSQIAGAAALGRTRTETIATALRLVWRQQAAALAESALVLRAALVELAGAHAVTIMGTFADSRAAAPTTLAHFLGGTLGALETTFPRFLAAINSIDRSPLGAGLAVGEVYGMDRHAAAELLGFDDVIENTFDAASAIEDLVQLPEAIAAHAAVIRRLATELLIWIRTDATSFFIDERWETVPEPAYPAHAVPSRLQALIAHTQQAESAARATVDLLRSLPYGPISTSWDAIADSMAATVDQGDRVLSHATEAIQQAIIVNRAYLANRAGRLYSTAADVAAFLMEDQQLGPAAAQRIAGLVIARLREASLEAAQITPDIIDAAAVMVIGQELKVEMETLGRYIAPRRYIERRDVLGSAKADRTRAWLDQVSARVQRDREQIALRQARWELAQTQIRRALAESAVSDL